MATEIGKLISVFSADFSQFDSALKRNDAGQKQVEAQSRRTGKALDDAFKTPSKSLEGLSQQLNSVFGGRMGGLTQGIGSLSTSLTSLQGSTGATGLSLAGLAGPAGIAVTGITAVAGAAISAASAVYGLVTSVSEGTGKFVDLSQATGFQVETLSALSNALETSGGDINSAAASLFMFETKMKEAQEAGTQMNKLFKQLGISTTDNEKALREAFVALSNMTRAEDQAKIGKMLFGRSVKDLIAALKEAGNFDAFLNEQLRKGHLVTTEAALRGDKLSDSIVVLGRTFEAARRIVADEFGPDVLATIRALDSALEKNRGVISEWAHDFKLAAHGAVDPLAASLINLNNIVQGLSGVPIPRILEFLFKYGTVQGLVYSGLKNIGAAMQAPTANAQLQSDLLRMDRMLNAPRSASIKALGGKNPFEAFAPGIVIPTGPGGRGGGGGEDPAKTAERIFELQLEAVKKGLQAEQDANKRALDLRRKDFNDYSVQYMAIENRRHDAVIAGLDREQKAAEKLKKGREVALQEIANKRTEENTTHEQNRNKVLDERGKILDGINKFLRDQEREISGLTSPTDQWNHAYQQLVDTLKEEGVALEENTRKRIEANIALAKEKELILSITRARRATGRLRFAGIAPEGDSEFINLGGGSFTRRDSQLNPLRSLSDLMGSTRPRFATSNMQILHAEIERVQDEMKGLGFELTGIFSRSVEDGIRLGGKQGLASFGLQLAEVVQRNFLDKIARGLGDLLSSAATGGGFWAGFLKTLGFGALQGLSGGILGGVGLPGTGGLGTGIADAISRDSGGPLWPDQLYKVHRDEYIMPTAPGFVIPKGSMGQQKIENHFHNIFQIAPSPGMSSNPKRSARQQAEMIAAFLQQSLA